MTIEDLIIALQDLAHRWDTSGCFTGDSHYDLGHDVGKQQCSEELTEILAEYEKK